MKDKRKLEIALITYNRADVVKMWFETFGLKILSDEEIEISVYDSSSNESTYNLLKQYMSENEKISYFRLDSSIRVDEKVLISIRNSKAEYVWPIGDSRYIDFNTLKIKLNDALYKSFDLISLLDGAKQEDVDKYVENPQYYLKNYWVYCTLLGAGIFRTSVFEQLGNEVAYRRLLTKYYKNDGFSYLGIFFELIANKKVNILNVPVKFIPLVENKKPGWLKRYLIVWCDNLIYLIDSLPSEYDEVKEFTLKNSWKIQKWDSWQSLYAAKCMGGLTIKDLYRSRKNLERVSTHKFRVALFCIMPQKLAIIVRNMYVVIRDGREKYSLKKDISGINK